MTHQEHVSLIKPAFPRKGGVWADFGSGDGAFTLALADILGKEAKIYSVDKDSSRLSHQKEHFSKQFPQAKVEYIVHDLGKFLALGGLDGVVMANLLHFFKDEQSSPLSKQKILANIKKVLKPKGKLIIVEYNVDEGNTWVPYPVSFESLKILLPENGFSSPKLLKTIPSYYLKEIYSSLSTNL